MTGPASQSSKAEISFPDPMSGCWLVAQSANAMNWPYYLCYAPPATPLRVLIWVASSRYTVEQCIKEAKGETGLDEYEVRFWHSWHRHVTLSMMAHAWLASIRAAEREKKPRK